MAGTGRRRTGLMGFREERRHVGALLGRSIAGTAMSALGVGAAAVEGGSAGDRGR